MTGLDSFAMSVPGGQSDNQDAVLADPELGLFLVADGMGGAAGGAEASRLAAQSLRASVAAMDRGSRLPETCLLEAVGTANRLLNDLHEHHPALAGLGTTLSALVVEGARGRIVHIGDSRIYLYRAGRLRQLTPDHTLVSELVDQRCLTEEQARAYPLRHVLSRSLGSRPTVEPDIQEVQFWPADRVLLATDGLWKALDDWVIERVLGEPDLQDARTMCARLMNRAVAAGAADDVSLVLVALGDAPERPGDRPDGALSVANGDGS